MEDRGSDGSDVGFERISDCFTKMRAGSLALLLALETGLTPEAQACPQCHGPRSIPGAGTTAAVCGQDSTPSRKPELVCAGLSTWHGSGQP